MLAADMTKVSLAEIEDDFAKASLVEVRASVIGAKLEMRVSVIGDAALHRIAVATVEALIFLKSLPVNVDLPTDAAGVLTPVGDALKAFIIFRCVQFHNSLLRVCNSHSS
jgi:hypothetical protein